MARATFTPSKYSPKARQNEAAVMSSAVVSDGKTRYEVKKDGSITVLDDTWGNKGAVYKEGTSTWNEMIKNLAVVGDNEDKLVMVLGAARVSAALSTPSLPAKTSGGGVAPGAAPGASPVPGGADEKTPLTQRKWFWPVVILSAAAVGGGALFYFTRKKGDEHESVPT